MRVEICLRTLFGVETITMAQHKDIGGPTSVLDLEATSNRTAEDLSIFSAPALEVVSQWWLESKRRWSARDGVKSMVPRVGVGRDDVRSG